MDVATFKTRYPELGDISDPTVQAALDQAARQMDATVWGDLFDDGQGAKAAHLIALSPSAAMETSGLRMGAGANQRTVYQDEFERLERIVGTSYRMVLD